MYLLLGCTLHALYSLVCQLHLIVNSWKVSSSPVTRITLAPHQLINKCRFLFSFLSYYFTCLYIALTVSSSRQAICSFFLSSSSSSPSLLIHWEHFLPSCLSFFRLLLHACLFHFILIRVRHRTQSRDLTHHFYFFSFFSLLSTVKSVSMIDWEKKERWIKWGEKIIPHESAGQLHFD